MQWNAAAYEELGGADTEPPAGRSELVADRNVPPGGRLPAAVREWFVRGGASRLAAISANMITQTEDLASGTVDRFARAGYVLLETDSQHSCRWVVATCGTDDDPPVYLIDPDDEACLTRTRYADRFSDYTFAHSWDAQLWRGDLITDFDHPLALDALGTLTSRLTALPTTYGWAMNQDCDAVYRFEGAARVAIAVSAQTAMWTAIAAPDLPTGHALAHLIGTNP